MSVRTTVPVSSGRKVFEFWALLYLEVPYLNPCVCSAYDLYHIYRERERERDGFTFRLFLATLLRQDSTASTGPSVEPTNPREHGITIGA